MSENAILILVTVTFVVLLFGYLIGSYIYKKKHHLPMGDCACCHKSKKQLLKEYHKFIEKE